MFYHINYYFRTLLATLVLMSLYIEMNAQDTENPSRDPSNCIGIYVGLFDFNVHYERTYIRRSKSLSSIRLGVGSGKFLVAGEGKYINPAWIHLFGRKNSHVEMNVGFKYMLTNSISNPDFREIFIPDLFLGYRFEKPTNGNCFARWT